MSTEPSPSEASAHSSPDSRHRGAPLAGRAAAFAQLAVANITREYPNSPAHLISGPDELIPPRSHHPAFYGAYDWHSSVHMHWLLVRLLRRHPDRIDVPAVLRALDAHLTPQAIAVEADYLRDHPSFERPYGWAWLLALAAETASLGEQQPSPGPEATGAAESICAHAARWAAALAPAVRTVSGLVLSWLPKATYPVRHGTHANSAFSLGLILDSAERAGAPGLPGPVAVKLRTWYLPDHGAATRWEPSGQDFLSPLLCEADAVRRILPGTVFADWLTSFLPELTHAPTAASAEPRGPQGLFLTPPRISDPADPQIGHLLGLCLSRAAALRRLAGALPGGDPRTAALTAAADAHLSAGLPATAPGDFTTDHWLATFAALALEEDPEAARRAAGTP